jgi:hypothetical protein
MKEIINRLKSPVVILQIVSIVATLIVTIVPEKETIVNAIVYAITTIINIFAGLNNPTDSDNF